MSKIFNLSNENKPINDWGNITEAYGTAVIDSIPSPDGNMSKKAPTSIPSPFARIALINTAFEYVNNSNNLDGDTVYHRLVSDCFDVAELFFNSDKFGDKIKIKTWDKNEGINNLLQSANPENRLLGETLQLFLNQDAQHNNFEDMDVIHLLYYNHKIVGGTSPITFFFSSANDLSFAKVNIGSNTLFDDNLNPLYNRDDNFLRYLYLTFCANNNLKIQMTFLWEYLEKTLNKLYTHNSSLYDEIMNFSQKNQTELNTQLTTDFDPADNGVAGGYLFFLGVPLMKLKSGASASTIAQQSQFIIESTKNNAVNKPLVLQNGLTTPLFYSNSNTQWNSKWEVPYVDDRPLDKRTLPNQADTYPYLTVSDFLEPYLVQLPYVINDNAYFNGKVTYENGDKEKSYLLPLTQRFFEYFTVEELQRGVNGLPMIEMKVYANSVEVLLRIPIKGNISCKYVTLTRTYKNGDIPNVEKNKGIIIENKISTTVFPFVKQPVKPFYRVILHDADIRETQHYSYSLSFYSDTKPIPFDKKMRSSKQSHHLQTEYYLLENNFDYMVLECNQRAKAVVIPKLKDSAGASEFKFAVDFGTTNSHIEYEVEGKKTTAFDITSDDIQYETLHDKETNKNRPVCLLSNIELEQDFFPDLIGKESEYKFPIRTAISHNKSFNFSTDPKVLADINIPFIYEKKLTYEKSSVSTNLKWSDFDVEVQDKERVKRFIENLMLLIRAKVLHNGGDLLKTKIVWFYPSSMNVAKLNNLTSIWDEFYHKYFNEQENTQSLPESIAPFYFYKANRGIATFDRPAVSVDIGGGTTDIVVFEGKKPILTTSARFAANSIFGDGYGGSPEINGFVEKYFKEFVELLNSNNLRTLKETSTQIKDSKCSSDIISFLFSVEKNEKVQKDIRQLVFSQRLAEDSELKIVFIVFYSSIVYHIAKLMKAKGLSIPQNILFSGTGAKTLLVVNGGNTNFTNIINKLTSIIFKKVYQETDTPKIEVLLEKKPKEVTCKGGLEYDLGLSLDDIRKLNDVWTGGKEELVSKSAMTFNIASKSEELLKEVEQEYKNFVELLFSINNEMSFNDYFEINTAKMSSYKEILIEDTMEYLKQGLEIKCEELSDRVMDKLDESLFFYPIVQVLNKLSYKITTELKR